MTRRGLQLEWAAALVLGVLAYVLPYFRQWGWWRFAPSTLILLGLGFVTLGAPAARFFGLRMRTLDLLTSLAAFGVAWVASLLILEGYVGSMVEVIRRATVASAAHQFFQVLNDELVVRAALLTLVLAWWPRPKIVIPLFALVFALGHTVLYTLRGVPLDLTTMATLFAFGVVANTLFVAFGHIGYGLALHYAWNLVRFNTRYVFEGRLLSEGESFNVIEGDPAIAAGALASMGVVYGLYVTSARARIVPRVEPPRRQ